MNYVKRHRKNENTKKIIIGIIIAICLVISIYLLSIVKVPLLSNISSKIVYNVDALASSIGGVFKEGFSFFGNTKKLNEEIDSLKEELERTRILFQEMSTIQSENNDLKKMLNIKQLYSHYDLIYAQIITRSYDNWDETFIINKGKKDGLKQKQNVICGEGLVGYISEVREDTSVVTTILDTSSAVSVEISNINSLALIKGDFSFKNENKVQLVNIPISADISLGDKVYSSGIGELYKKGLPIGEVIQIEDTKNNIDRTAIVKVSADIQAIDIVGVIID